MVPATPPMTIASIGWTKPEAGVMATKPATAPAAAPTTLPFPVKIQLMFAVITPALITGAFAERAKFSTFVVFMLLWATLVYDPIAHWVWGQGGGAGVDVDGGAAGEVQGIDAGALASEVERREPAPSGEDPVGHGVVDEERPEEHEDEKSAELGPLGEGAGNQGRRDDGEHHLEYHERLVGYGGGVGVRWRQPHVLEAEPGEIADDAALAGAEGQGVADDHPLDAHQPDDDEALHDGAEHVLAAREARVEEAEARRHEHDERGGHEEPRSITAVYIYRHDR